MEKSNKSKNEYAKDYYWKNRESLNEKRKIRYQQNKHRLSEYYKQYREQHREYFREYAREKYKRNKEKQIAHRLAVVQKRKTEITRQSGSECQKCHTKVTEQNLCIFDFHHKNPSTKETKQEWIKPNFDISKVELLCSNCHRLIHYEQKRNSSNYLKTVIGITEPSLHNS